MKLSDTTHLLLVDLVIIFMTVSTTAAPPTTTEAPTTTSPTTTTAPATEPPPEQECNNKFLNEVIGGGGITCGSIERYLVCIVQVFDIVDHPELEPMLEQQLISTFKKYKLGCNIDVAKLVTSIKDGSGLAGKSRTSAWSASNAATASPGSMTTVPTIPASQQGDVVQACLASYITEIATLEDMSQQCDKMKEAMLCIWKGMGLDPLEGMSQLQMESFQDKASKMMHSFGLNCEINIYALVRELKTKKQNRSSKLLSTLTPTHHAISNENITFTVKDTSQTIIIMTTEVATIAEEMSSQARAMQDTTTASVVHNAAALNMLFDFNMIILLNCMVSFVFIMN